MCRGLRTCTFEFWSTCGFLSWSRVEKVSLLIKSVIMNDSANIYYVFFFFSSNLQVTLAGNFPAILEEY